MYYADSEIADAGVSRTSLRQFTQTRVKDVRLATEYRDVNDI